MRVPNNLPTEHTEDITAFLEERERPSPIQLAETAGNRLASENPYFPNLDRFLSHEQLDGVMTQWELDERERVLFRNWFEQGVRNNTAVWLYAAGESYSPFFKGDEKRALATLMFIDIFNRADEVFDEYRELFIDNRTGRIDTSSLERTPLLAFGEDYGDLGQLRGILYKAIEHGGAYTEQEADLLKWHIEHFMQVSTTAQQDFEHKKKYTQNEALALRWLTVGPMTDTIGSLYALSPLEMQGGKYEQMAFSANRTFLKMVIAWQLVDDYYDMIGDYQRGNINLVLGTIMDEGEYLPSKSDVWRHSSAGSMTQDEEEDYGYENSDDTFSKSHSKTVAELRTLYKYLTDDLPEEAKEFLNQRVPYLFYSEE